MLATTSQLCRKNGLEYIFIENGKHYICEGYTFQMLSFWLGSYLIKTCHDSLTRARWKTRSMYATYPACSVFREKPTLAKCPKDAVVWSVFIFQAQPIPMIDLNIVFFSNADLYILYFLLQQQINKLQVLLWTVLHCGILYILNGLFCVMN